MNKFLKIGRLTFCWFLVFIGWLAVGCASSKQYAFSPPPLDLFETNKAGLTIERSMVGDLIIVKFSGGGEGDGQPLEERIKEDGTITLPLIGAVKANDKTAHELETEIKNSYVPEYYKRLSVAVAIGRGFYWVGGQVQRPGRYNYLGPTTVIKAIEFAGGFTEFAGRRRVELVRANGKRYLFDCKKAAQDASLDLPVHPGDKIAVPQIQVLQGPLPRDIFR
jgi:polysaccharide export outer membrane protein